MKGFGVNNTVVSYLLKSNLVGATLLGMLFGVSGLLLLLLLTLLGGLVMCGVMCVCYVMMADSERVVSYTRINSAPWQRRQKH